QPVAAREQQFRQSHWPAEDPLLGQLVHRAEHGRHDPGGRDEHPRTDARWQSHGATLTRRSPAAQRIPVEMTVHVSRRTVRVFAIARTDARAHGVTMNMLSRALKTIGLATVVAAVATPTLAQSPNADRAADAAQIRAEIERICQAFVDKDPRTLTVTHGKD